MSRVRSLLATCRSELERKNFAGRTVTLAEGAAVVLGTGLLAGSGRTDGDRDAAVLVGIGALGLLDDLLEPHHRAQGRPVSKGLRGHFGALRQGRVTTGALKALGIPALAVLATAGAADRSRSGRVSLRGAGLALADAALVAGAANFANLLDLRPGRALKVVLPAATALAILPPGEDPSGRRLALAAAVPAALALPVDLREHGMLGDAGANALGAAVGLAATRTLPVPARLVLLGGITALTVASERVSFSAVIESTPVLRAVDRLGRRAPEEAGR